MTDRIVLDGDSVLDLKIDGTCTLSNVTDGEGMAIVKIHDTPPYTGPVEFTPSAETQTIECFQMLMPENIVINPIPNNYGLITWNGSTLTVS